MKSHVAILRREYADLLLAGTKTIESRLSRVRGPAFGKVFTGDSVFIKQSSGPFIARATVSEVLHRLIQSPQELDDIRTQFDHAIIGTDEYWRSKIGSRYCSLIWLADFTTQFTPPHYRRWRGFSPRAAWIVGPTRRLTNG